MSDDLSRFAINQITTPRWTLPEALEGYKRQGIGGIAVWRQFLEAYGVAQTRKHLRQLEMWVPSLCTSEWLNVSIEQSMGPAIDTNRRLLDAAAEIGATCLMMVVGGMLLGWVKDAFDSRQSALLGFGTCMLIGGALALTYPNPEAR
ncbi:hypothetical protein QZM62_25355 [Burkholderia multivorans]|nr:hypothetical protein [Burkholderia multivorans]